MRFRHASSHAECTECVKHKSVIQSLSHHLLARRTQQELFYRHLEDQFRDRIVYWKTRSDSRSRPDSLTVIVDGMDQAKCSVPRHTSLKAKLFDGLQRPRLHLSAAIGHGRFIALFLTESDMPKDANFCIETVCCALTLASKSMDLSCTDVIIQCDNTPRELKNGHFLRLCAALVSNKTVKSMGASCLRTGHSHEDVDQLFGELERPHEGGRFVFKVDQVRDWRPWLLEAIPARLIGIGGPGAPHVFEFSRFDATGRFFVKKCFGKIMPTTWLLPQHDVGLGKENTQDWIVTLLDCRPGLSEGDVDDKLYKKEYRWHPHDVILRRDVKAVQHRVLKQKMTQHTCRGNPDQDVFVFDFLQRRFSCFQISIVHPMYTSFDIGCQDKAMDGGRPIFSCLSVLSAGDGIQTSSSWFAWRPGSVKYST